MRTAYAVWDRAAALSAVVPVAIAAVVIVMIGTLADRSFVTAVAVPVLALVAAGRARTAGRLLAVSDRGIVLRGRTAAWRHVEAVGVGSDHVEVVLDADAPLPGWMTSRISDPTNPDDRVRLRDAVPGLDVSRLTAAVSVVQSARHVRLETL